MLCGSCARKRVFVFEQPALPVQPPGIALEVAIARDHPVARHHDRDGIRADGRSDVERRPRILEAEPLGAHALERYFCGALDVIDSLPTATAGSDLQRQVWAALRRIPAGSTTTYGRLRPRYKCAL